MRLPTRPVPACPRPVPQLEGLAPYAVARPLGPIDLFLDGNEGASPSPDLLNALLEGGTELLRRYPSARSLESLLAARLGVAPEQVLITAGGDEALDRVARAFLAPGRDLILPAPTFEMLPRYARLAGARLVEVPWLEGPFPVESVLARAGERTAVIAVVTPNNPTGAVATAEDLRRISAAAPHAVLLVDLAYVEFAEQDPTPEALRLPNAIVVRTFSKARGLAGLRVGYAVGPASLVQPLRACGNPYAVSGPSLALASASLRSEADMARFVSQVRAIRARLLEHLESLGARPQPSQANFVLARFRDAVLVRDALAALGIAVRHWPGRPGLEDALRVSCPEREEDALRLQRALTAALRPRALLFDLDGVIADVSGSYRQAIVQTAASYGVSLEAAEVSRAKAQGGANDDWELTARLLAGRGVEAPLEEVTQRFEALYQGSEGRQGLSARERPLVSREWLARLSRRLPLAVVTGRPRADAERFLARNGLRECFAALVSREDGPLKPDPAPVQAALATLGVESAWMVGDTVDDIRAARAAGVVPFGVVAPGEPRDEVERALLQAGAARVLTDPTTLEELLP